MDRLKHQLLGSHSNDARLTLTYLSIAFTALFIGVVLGLLQSLERAGLTVLPTWFNYYEILTAHGFILVLVFTATFVVGYLYAALSHTLDGLLPIVRKIGWIALVLMVVGVLFVVTTVLRGESTVLYTFYPPMQASPWFYIGLVLIIVGVWLTAFGAFINVANWRKRHPGQHIPLLSFFVVGIFVLLFFGTLGVTTEVLILIPWAFGWTDTVNVLLSRTLFWSFGHTLVNVWYLSAVSVWYVAIPRIVDGKLFSDTLTRVVIIMLVILNIPGGFHHQIVDPGFSQHLKFIHVIMSVSIAFPSLMTAFAMFAVFERMGRKKGATGLLGWFKKLPWGDVRFLAPFIAMVAFIPAGAGGIAQTNNQLNQVVHNTLWVTGHFHLTVGTSVVLTFFGAVYWLIPYLSKRVLTPRMNRLGIIQTIIWSTGMLFLAGAMHIVGLFGSPRRTSYSTYGDNINAAIWDPYLVMIAVAGALLVIGAILIVYIVFDLMFFAPKGKTEFPIGQPEEDASPTPKWTERWGLWIALMLVVIAVGYVIPLVDLIMNAPPESPPFKTW